MNSNLAPFLGGESPSSYNISHGVISLAFFNKPLLMVSTSYVHQSSLYRGSETVASRNISVYSCLDSLVSTELSRELRSLQLWSIESFLSCSRREGIQTMTSLNVITFCPCERLVAFLKGFKILHKSCINFSSCALGLPEKSILSMISSGTWISLFKDSS